MNKALVTSLGLFMGLNVAAGGLFLAAKSNQQEDVAAPTSNESVNTSPVAEPVVPVNAPANKVTLDLLQKFPSKGLSQNGTVSPIAVGIPLDFQCASKSANAATLTKSMSYAPKAGGGGTSVQVRAYPAGLGGQAVQELKDRAQRCNGFSVSPSSVAGDESIVIFDSGSPSGGGVPGTTVVFRQGDVLGVVSQRGSGYNSTISLANRWATSWNSVLTKSVCPGIGQTNDAPERSPLSENYKGWVRKEPVALTNNDTVIANAAELIWLRSSVSSIPRGVKSGELPQRPEKAFPQDTTLPNYPESLNVSLPNAPKVSPEPSFPQEPTGLGTIMVTADDIVGPGCGWAFTGLEKPVYDKKTSVLAADTARASKLSDLRNSYALWAGDRWGYLTQYSSYIEQSKKREQWVANSTTAIATAWWADYEKKRISYETDYAIWQTAFESWKISNAICEANNNPTPTPTPTPTVTGSPTPTPSPTMPTPTPSPTVNCPSAPEAPTRPSKPRVDKPN